VETIRQGLRALRVFDGLRRAERHGIVTSSGTCVVEPQRLPSPGRRPEWPTQPSTLLVDLRRGVEHDKNANSSDEVGVGDQPALVLEWLARRLRGSYVGPLDADHQHE